MISKKDIRNIIHQLIRVSLPNEKLNRPEELKFLSPIDNVSKGSTSLHEPAFSFIIGKETPKDSKTTFSDIMTLITSEALYPFYMELPPDEFIERLNKTIYKFVSEQLKADKERNVPDEDDVWIIPNSAFVNWFQESGIDIESIESFAEKKEEVEKEIKEYRHQKANQTNLDKEYINLFRNDGATWTINFNDINKTIKHTKGMDYIALLLRHQGQRLHSMEMYQIISEIVPDVDERMSKTSPEMIDSNEGFQVKNEKRFKMLDQKTVDVIKGKIIQLKAESNQAMMENDLIRENIISTKLDKLNDYLSKCTYKGKIRTVSDANERMRQSIYRAINTAKKNIKKHHKKLFKHLDKFLTTGTFNSYSPDTPVSWVQNQ